MEAIIGLAIFGVIIMIALFLGQMLLYAFFAIIALVFTAIVGAFKAVINLFKGE